MNTAGRTSNQEHNVVVLGASHKPSRYSNIAIRMLLDHGYRVIPVHPVQESIEDLRVVHQLRDVQGPVHTLTLYVGPERCRLLVEDIVAMKPGRVIMNPGTEFPELEKRLHESGIPVILGCTLVMLQSGQF